MSKKKKLRKSDKMNAKRMNANIKTQNPFEVYVNKEKFKVLGKKSNKQIGLPLVSRSKAIDKRKKTLLEEYKLQNKANKFSDKRIGEKVPNMTLDDKNIARFTAVRVKAHKKSIFNLADDEVLTHQGHTLTEIEKFDDPRSDDESDFDEKGELNSRFVEEAHFGGGLLKKTNHEGVQTHKDLIEQLITESKKRKAEKQKIKEATLELTEKLDTEWKDLVPLVREKKSSDQTVQKENIDDYDKLMRELKFAARGGVSDRLKTEDEIAKEEKAKLEQLEQERLSRMKGISDENKIHTVHRSADDIDDNIVYEEVNENDILTYNDEGKSNIPINKKSFEIIKDSIESNSEEEELDSSESASEEDSDNMSDLKDNSSDDEIENINENQKNEIIEEKNKNLNETDCDKNICEKDEMNECSEKNKAIEQAEKELPYTFSLPESYDDLQKLLDSHTSVQQSVIIERMIKCNHHSLAEGNKDKLGLLFAYLLQYLNDKFDDIEENESSIKKSFQIFQDLSVRLYELAQVNPENAHHSLLEIIKEKHEDYKKKMKKFTGLEVLMFFKVVSILLPTSDFRHQVVTPCFIFMEQLLTKCKVLCKRDISYGIFLLTLILEFTNLSKRFMPAAVRFISGILHMAIPKTGPRIVKVLPPFKPLSSDLVLTAVLTNNKSECLEMDTTCLLNTAIDDVYKIKALHTTLKITAEFHQNFQELPSCVEIFKPVLQYLEAIPINNYPSATQTVYEDLLKTLHQSRDNQKLSYIAMQAMKPKALRMLEPKIVEVYDGKRHRVQSKTKAERDKLMHKLKKEKKGALREIRRDKNFLGRVKIQQQVIRDKERQEKVNRIYAEASLQQSELNALDRKKRKK